jgi:hypothetical protein
MLTHVLSFICVNTIVSLQVVRTTIQPLHGGKASAYDAYEYNAHSHTYVSDHQPTAKFSYDLAAMQVGLPKQYNVLFGFLKSRAFQNT